MGDVTRRLSAKSHLTPDTGYNVVGVDDFEPAGEDLYFIAHVETRAEAEALAEERRKGHTDRVYVYGPADEE